MDLLCLVSIFSIDAARSAESGDTKIKRDECTTSDRGPHLEFSREPQHQKSRSTRQSAVGSRNYLYSFIERYVNDVKIGLGLTNNINTITVQGSTNAL